MSRHAHTHHTPLPMAVTLALMFALCLSSLVACHRQTTTPDEPEPVRVAEPKGPYYDAGAFHLRDGRYYYDDGTTVVERTGIDVSSHQDAIDWAAVASDGISFAFLRIGYRGSTEGGLYADERFFENLWQAQAAGIACGAYFYSQATSAEEAREEAAFALDLLTGVYLDLPVAFDYERDPASRTADTTPQTASEAASAFCETIQAAGYTPMLYGNTFDLARVRAAREEGYAVWCAEYDDSPSCIYRAQVWQYTNQGHVAGVEGYSDLNLYLGDVP